MNHYYKGKAKNTLAWLSTLLLIVITLYSSAYDANPAFFHSSLTADTIPVKNPDSSGIIDHQPNVSPVPVKKNQTDSTISSKTDTIIRPSIDTLSFKSSKDSLTEPVTYHADDSMVFDVPQKKMLLYGKQSNVKYIDNELTAPHIEYDQQSNLMKAYLEKDSAGNVIASPTYNQADFKSISDSIVFNMKTGKGLTKGTYTQQGEMFIYGEKIKKVDTSVFYAYRGRFTTCNLDTPHFSFVSKKIKFINKKWAFTGPVHPEIEGVPLPVLLPFGIYPLTQGRHSGLIAPSFTANDQLGMALEGLGYYKILSENWDVIARGTIYSYGGWTLNVSPRYFRKYRYQGNFSLDMQKFKNGFKGDPDYTSNQTYNIRWSHNADTKARPGVTFNASVNAGSSKFNSQVPNSPNRNFTNQLNSSIAYSKVWKDKPFNLTVSANHNQNTALSLININFPDVAFNVNTLYPFRRKEMVGEYKWYENIGVAFNTTAKSLSSFYDTAGNIGRQLTDNLRWGASHSVPITLSLPAIGPLQISPSVSYQERWFDEKFIRTWNAAEKKLDTTIQKGYYTARDMSFGISMLTRIFGSFTFGKNSKVQAIRHEIRPSVSLSYKPNFNSRNFYTTQIDTLGNTATETFYQRSIYGSFSSTRFAGLNFGIDNILQMKVRNKKDTGENALKKVSLIDGLSIQGNYNFLLDSFQFSTLSVSARSNLFEKINITANAVFDPYQTNAEGRRINKLVWAKKPVSLGTLMSGAVSLQSQFRGGDKGSGSTNDGNLNNPNDLTRNPNAMPLDEYQQEAAYIQNNPGEFVDFSIPWDVSFSYSLRFSKSRIAGGFRTNFFQDVNFNSSVNLTPKWKIGMTGSYNITQKEIGVLSMYLSRDLHCWQMSINLAPVGRFKFFTINISPKSNLLRDIKVNRTRYFYDL
jgi:LPS-assembly protein